MQRNAGRVATARLAASLSVLIVSAGVAIAGDAAQFEPLGFSPDGRYFAFEEYGIQDGSGFPYSTVTILDVAEDKWVAGSPFRIRLDNEASDLAAARAKARAAAAPHLDEMQLDVPATTVALNGDGEPAGDGSLLNFGKPGYDTGGPSDLATLTLTTTSPAYSGPCTTDYGFDPPVGYTLTLESGGATTELHADDSVPASRGCTVAYRLYGVFAARDWGWSGQTPVAVISVFTNGFEGPDRRFLAVPVAGYP